MSTVPLESNYRKNLTPFQLDILEECLNLKNGGLSIPMGSGKSHISLALSLELTHMSQSPIIVVVSKTLIQSWIFEINKFFKEEFKVLIFHKDFIKNIDSFEIPEDTKIILTTPEIMAKAYTEFDMDQHFTTRVTMNQGRFGQHEIVHYNIPKYPFLKATQGFPLLFSIKFGALIIDESQKVSNINSDRCRGIAAIYADYRWCLSGTLFNEPKIEKILGYYLFIGNSNFPDNIPEATKLIGSKKFTGFNNTCVIRTEQPFKISIKNHIININLSEEESQIYFLIKELVLDLNKKVKEFKAREDVINLRKFSGYLLAMLTYLRQCIVSPMIPISKLSIDLSDFKTKDQLADIFIEKLNKLNLTEYFENEDNLTSTRIKAVIDKIKNHRKIVIFSVYRTTLDLLEYLIIQKYNRNVYTISGEMTIEKRKEILINFEEDSDGILLLTFTIGSEGLNLQKAADTVMFLDYDWNSGITKQALSRIVRQGQMNEVNIYYFVSNTGIEAAIFTKQKQKLELLDELSKGGSVLKVDRIKTKEIIILLENEENKLKIKGLKI